MSYVCIVCVVDPVMAERLSIVDPVMAERLSAEWLQSEQRMAMAADPMVRLQMAGLHQSAAVAAAAAAAHTHTHAHAHTHLHLHQPDPALGVPLGLGPQTPAGMVGNLFVLVDKKHFVNPFFFFGLSPICSRRIKFSLSLFSGLIMFCGVHLCYFEWCVLNLKSVLS